MPLSNKDLHSQFGRLINVEANNGPNTIFHLEIPFNLVRIRPLKYTTMTIPVYYYTKPRRTLVEVNWIELNVNWNVEVSNCRFLNDDDTSRKENIWWISKFRQSNELRVQGTDGESTGQSIVDFHETGLANEPSIFDFNSRLIYRVIVFIESCYKFWKDLIR